MKMTKFFSVAALMGVLAMSASCSKDEAIENRTDGKTVTLTVNQEVLSRTTLTDENNKLSVVWDKGDQLSAFTTTEKPNLEDNSTFTLVGEGGTNTATFTGSVTGDPQVLYAYLKNKANVVPHSKGVAYSPKVFFDSLDELSDYHFLCAIFKKQADGNYSCEGVKHAGAVFELNISGLNSGEEITGLSFSDFTSQIVFRANEYPASTEISIIGGGTVLALENTEGVTVGTNGEATLYAIVPPGGTTGSGTITLTLSDNSTKEKTVYYTKPISGKAYTVDLDF